MLNEDEGERGGKRKRMRGMETGRMGGTGRKGRRETDRHTYIETERERERGER